MLVKKKDLISLIQDTETFTNPKIELEQYCIDASSAVDIIYFAGVEFTDIQNNIIFDLGAGTGRLSIASALLNAHSVISVDIDWKALTILKKNVRSLALEGKIYSICSDVKYFTLSNNFLKKKYEITTIMNPPFGVKKRTADRIFLEKAFSFSDIVYSIHLSGEKIHKFITNFIKKFKWTIDYILPFNMILENTFKFHEKKAKIIDVKLYRFIKK